MAKQKKADAEEIARLESELKQLQKEAEWLSLPNPPYVVQRLAETFEYQNRGGLTVILQDNIAKQQAIQAKLQELRLKNLSDKAQGEIDETGF